MVHYNYYYVHNFKVLFVELSEYQNRFGDISDNVECSWNSGHAKLTPSPCYISDRSSNLTIRVAIIRFHHYVINYI